MDEEFLELSEIILKSKDCLNFLKESIYANPQSYEDISKAISNLENNAHMYVSSPFRNCSSKGIELYALMKSLSKDLDKKIKLKKTTDE